MLITAQLLRLKTLSIIFIDLSARPGFPGRVFYVQTRAVELCRFGGARAKAAGNSIVYGHLGRKEKRRAREDGFFQSERAAL